METNTKTRFPERKCRSYFLAFIYLCGEADRQAVSQPTNQTIYFTSFSKLFFYFWDATICAVLIEIIFRKIAASTMWCACVYVIDKQTKYTHTHAYIESTNERRNLFLTSFFRLCLFVLHSIHGTFKKEKKEMFSISCKPHPTSILSSNNKKGENPEMYGEKEGNLHNITFIFHSYSHYFIAYFSFVCSNPAKSLFKSNTIVGYICFPTKTQTHTKYHEYSICSNVCWFPSNLSPSIQDCATLWKRMLWKP